MAYTRTEIIQGVIDYISAEHYLEIGLDQGVNFNAIKVDHKVGVDLQPLPSYVRGNGSSNVTHEMSSANFFAWHSSAQFDAVFIDGDHRYDGVKADLECAWRSLKSHGIIVMHDVHPRNKEQLFKRPRKAYCGFAFRAFHEELSRESVTGFSVVDDYGVGILARRNEYPDGPSAVEPVRNITLRQYAKDRNKYANSRDSLCGAQNLCNMFLGAKVKGNQ